MHILYRIIYIFYFSFFFVSVSFGSNNAHDGSQKDDPKKMIVAARFVGSVKIDGILDEEIWLLAKPGENFTQLEPNSGLPAANNTIIKVAYDDAAL